MFAELINEYMMYEYTDDFCGKQNYKMPPLIFVLFVFWPYPMTYGILVPQPGIESMPLIVEV